MNQNLQNHLALCMGSPVPAQLVTVGGDAAKRWTDGRAVAGKLAAKAVESCPADLPAAAAKLASVVITTVTGCEGAYSAAVGKAGFGQPYKSVSLRTLARSLAQTLPQWTACAAATDRKAAEAELIAKVLPRLESAAAVLAALPGNAWFYDEKRGAVSLTGLVRDSRDFGTAEDWGLNL